MPSTLEILTEVTSADSYDLIAQTMVAQRSAVIDNKQLYTHVDALAQIMPRLKLIVAQLNQIARDGEQSQAQG